MRGSEYVWNTGRLPSDQIYQHVALPLGSFRRIHHRLRSIPLVRASG